MTGLDIEGHDPHSEKRGWGRYALAVIVIVVVVAAAVLFA